MKDYSQFGEQATILESLGLVEDRSFTSEAAANKESWRFLDIGANHPTTFSNTRALFELGFSGIMIEPSPVPMRNLLTEYGWEPRITLIQACVGTVAGLMDIFVTDDLVSTSSEAEFKKWEKREDNPSGAQFAGKMFVPAITMETIMNQFGGFDFINLDAEGYSAELFLQMMAIGFFPTCICVEHDDRVKELLSIATANHYKGVLSNGTNLVVARG